MKVLLPFLVLIVAGATTATAIFLRPKPESREPIVTTTPIQAMVADSRPTQLIVHSQGTVMPDKEATIATEVSGLVIDVSPRFETGFFVEEGEVLLRLDPTNFEAAFSEARANLLSAETALIQAEADAEQAIEDLRQVGIENPSALARREPQLEQARLLVDSAQAALDLAAMNLERTQIKAPFAGQIIETLVDKGDVLAGTGAEVGRIFGTNEAEVRLFLSRDDLTHLKLPATPSAINAAPEEKPKVTLTAGEGNNLVERTGWIDRLEGNTDSVTRLRGAVARFEDPLAIHENEPEAPIAFGSFVRAKIHGDVLPSAFRIPIVALVGEDKIRIIDSENRLQERTVTIRKRNGTDMVITAGLKDGELICLTPLGAFVPGMPVRIEDNGS